MFLIHRNPIRVFQVFLHLGNGIFYGLAPLFALDELRNVVHGTGAIEGVHGDKILKHTWFQLTQVLLHPWRFKLEGTDGVAGTIQLVSGGVINRDVVNVNIYTSGFLDVGNGILDEREGLQSEEVHLDKSDGFDDVPVVLCDNDTFPGVLVLNGGHGHHIGEVVCPDDDTTGMNADLAVGVL